MWNDYPFPSVGTFIHHPSTLEAKKGQPQDQELTRAVRETLSQRVQWRRAQRDTRESTVFCVLFASKARLVKEDGNTVSVPKPRAGGLQDLLIHQQKDKCLAVGREMPGMALANAWERQRRGEVREWVEEREEREENKEETEKQGRKGRGKKERKREY